MEAIQIDSGGKQGPRPEAAVIWLHGLGADGWDFVPIVRELAAAGRRLQARKG